MRQRPVPRDDRLHECGARRGPPTPSLRPRDAARAISRGGAQPARLRLHHDAGVAVPQGRHRIPGVGLGVGGVRRGWRSGRVARDLPRPHAGGRGAPSAAGGRGAVPSARPALLRCDRGGGRPRGHRLREPLGRVRVRIPRGRAARRLELRPDPSGRLSPRRRIVRAHTGHARGQAAGRAPGCARRWELGRGRGDRDEPPRRPGGAWRGRDRA